MNLKPDTAQVREYLTEDEAAEFLNKSKATLRRYRARRIGPAFCKPAHSKTPIYIRSDLIKWIEGARVMPRGDA